MGHHYIPREYLRGFADPLSPEALWQFDKKHGTFSSSPAAISKIAQQRSFYDDETEVKLNELVEIPGNRVLRKLRSGDLNLTDEDRINLSVYIATMMKRVPHHRDKGIASVPSVLAKVTEELRDEIHESAESGDISAEDADKYLADTDTAEEKYSNIIPAKVMEQIRKPWPSERIIAAIYNMHWRFVSAVRDQDFVTTDNPAFFFECFGVGTEKSELTIPVSSKLAIFGSRTPVRNGDRVSTRTQFVKEANRRLISMATRFIYTRSRALWIPVVASKIDPYLSRIKW